MFMYLQEIHARHQIGNALQSIHNLMMYGVSVGH